MAKEKRPKTYTRLAREAQTPVIGGTCMTLVVAGLVSEAMSGASKMAIVAAVLFACAGVYLFWLAYRIDKQVKEEQAAAAAAAESASEAAEPEAKAAEPGAKAAAANAAGSAAKSTAGTPGTAPAPKAGAGRIAAMASWTAAEDPEADSGAGPEADPGEGPEEDSKEDTEGKNDGE